MKFKDIIEKLPESEKLIAKNWEKDLKLKINLFMIASFGTIAGIYIIQYFGGCKP